MNWSEDSKIAVVGAGVMGSGIAQIAAQAGHQVTIVDVQEAALDRSRTHIHAALDKLASRGKLSEAARDAVLQRMAWTSALADIGSATLVIEAIIEDRQAKASLFAALEPYLRSDAVLATNTSSLSVTTLAEPLRHPDRFIGLHFFNPVPTMKLVEVVPGTKTEAQVTDQLLALMKAWGKTGIKVKDVPGFIVNRVARPYYAEGFAALAGGVQPAVIDRILETAGGFRMGPLALADMIGHDVNYTVAVSVYDAYEGHTRFRPQPPQKALVDIGKLGRKGGAGVYQYDEPLPEAVPIEPGDAPAAIEVGAAGHAVTAIAELAATANIGTAIADGLPTGAWRSEGFTMAFTDGRTLAERADVDVLVDHARDLSATPVLAITARDAQGARAAASLFRALGKSTLLVPDRAGMLVLRTLVQLANAAGDAVAEGVATAEDVDTAMRFGANHPEGPLSWASRVGQAHLARIAANIAASEDDQIYAPSRYFEQRGA